MEPSSATTTPATHPPPSLRRAPFMCAVEVGCQNLGTLGARSPNEEPPGVLVPRRFDLILPQNGLAFSASTARHQQRQRHGLEALAGVSV